MDLTYYQIAFIRGAVKFYLTSPKPRLDELFKQLLEIIQTPYDPEEVKIVCSPNHQLFGALGGLIILHERDPISYTTR